MNQKPTAETPNSAENGTAKRAEKKVWGARREAGAYSRFVLRPPFHGPLTHTLTHSPSSVLRPPSSVLLVVLLLAGCHRPTKLASRVQPINSSPLRFADRAGAAGVRFKLGHGGRSPLNILQTAGCGCAFVDYDGDGYPDIFLVGQPRCALYRNLGNGAFEDVTEQAGITATGTFMGVAVGDYDNDGRPDLLVTGYGRSVLYHNAGGRFVDVTASSGLAARGPYDWSTSATFVDLDNDGKLDLAVCHYVRFTSRSLQTCSYAGVPAACPPFYYDPQSLRVYRGDGRGHFKDMTAAWGFSGGHGLNLGVAAADFDGSGNEGLYVANDGLPADLWQKSGRIYRDIGAASGTAYDENGQVQSGMGVDWGDYDGDGRLDLVVTTFQDQEDALYQNEGHGQFRFVSPAAGIGAATVDRLAFGVAFADFDDDGRPDLIIANGHVQDTVARFRPGVTYAQPLQLFHNTNGRIFADVSLQSGTAFHTPIVGRGIAIGDYDNDGRPDALVVNLEGRPLLLHNESPAGHWLGVKLVGVKCNRDAIGARVTLSAGGRQQVREIQTGRGYLSASDPRALFGVGKNTKIQSLQIRWPDGRSQTVTLPGIDRYLTIREG